MTQPKLFETKRERGCRECGVKDGQTRVFDGEIEEVVISKKDGLCEGCYLDKLAGIVG